MFLSVFTDELRREVTEVLPIFAEWGMQYVDFRGRINGKPIEKQTDAELKALKAQLDALGLRAGVIQSSLCKRHLADMEAIRTEQEKLDGIIRASEILETPMVRSFHFWQHDQNDPHCGDLVMRPDALSEVLEWFDPIARRAKEAGLVLGFENCGVTPDEAIAVIEALNVKGWGLAWDVSNMFELLPEAKGDCIAYFTKALRYANMLHVKSRGVLPESSAKKVPWERVLKGALTTGRDMPVSIETHLPKEITTLTPEEATKRCYSYLKRVWPESAPADLATALAVKPRFERPYENDPVRMAVVGLGMGKNRCAQITDTCGIKLAGVCDIRIEKAQAVGEQYGVPYSDDMETFLKDPTVEAIYVVTPTGTHCELAERAIRAGKHVLVTKPMDVTHERCRALAELAGEKGVILGCDFDLHFRGPLKELKNAVEDGYFGTLKSVNTVLNIKRTTKYYGENGGWRGTLALDGGGALSNQGIHEIDRILSVFGMPKRVRGTVLRQTFDIEAEDFGSAEMEYENGMIARLSSTTSYPASSWYTRIEVYGDAGAYLLTAGGPEGDHVYWWKDGAWTEDSPYPVKREWNQAADNFASAIRMGTPLTVTAENGIRSRYVLDRIYESARSDSGWITL